MYKTLSILVSVCLFTFNLIGQTIKEDTNTNIIDLKKFFTDFKGAFILYDSNKDEYKLYDHEICTTRYSPCSTFKIANSLISFETGIVPDTSFVIPYDSLGNPLQVWMRDKAPYKYWMLDNSINMAFKYSSVWYYQEVARRIGIERMQNFVNSFNYGNKDISGGIDRFWLCSSINISPAEQIEFLKKLYNEKLPGISSRSTKLLKDIMLAEQSNKYKIYAKTGGGNCENGNSLGWYVGFIERDDNVFFFAYIMFTKDFDLIMKKRIETTKNILKELKIID